MSEAAEQKNTMFVCFYYGFPTYSFVSGEGRHHFPKPPFLQSSGSKREDVSLWKQKVPWLCGYWKTLEIWLSVLQKLKRQIRESTANLWSKTLPKLMNVPRHLSAWPMRFSALSWQYYNNHFYCAFSASFIHTWFWILYLINTLIWSVNWMNHAWINQVQERLESLSKNKCDRMKDNTFSCKPAFSELWYLKEFSCLNTNLITRV